MKLKMIGNTRRKLRYNPDLVKVVVKEFEEEKRRKLLENKLEPKKAAAKTTAKSNLEFSIEELDDRYVISPISYHNGLYEVSWSRELLDGGNSYAQDEWLEILEEGEWSLAPCPLYHATLTALYYEKDGTQKDKIENFRNLFTDNLKDNWIVTGTTILYTLSKKDIVFHYDPIGDLELDVNIFGAPGFISRSIAATGQVESIEALFGTRDVGEVEKVYEWVSGKKPYLSVLDKITDETKEEMANKMAIYPLGFHLDHDRLGIYVDVTPEMAWCARGVVLQEISTGK